MTYRCWTFYFFSFVAIALHGDEVIHVDKFDAGLDNWVVEQFVGGSVSVQDGVLDIEDESGCTVWFKHELKAPVRISYEVEVVMEGGPYDRLSDLNCFWMASDPLNPDDLFEFGHARSGHFPTYNGLQTYYVGYGGNKNQTTRFRRYLGNGEKPLLPEHDLRASEYLLELGRTYHIVLEAVDGYARFIRDDEVIFEYEDPFFLSEGWFGIRTFKSHLRVRNFRVESLSL